MRWLLFLVIAAMGMFEGHSQTLVQTYTDRCTGEVKVFSVQMGGQTVVAYYNKSRVFTSTEFTNGTLQAWLEETYAWWQALSPCSTGNATSQTTQQTTNQATTNATNAANNATSNATNNTGTTNTGTTGTTNTNTNNGSTNTGSTSSGSGSSSSSSGSSSGSSSSGSSGSNSGGSSSGGSDSSGGDSSGNTGNDNSGGDNSGNDSGGDSSGGSDSGGSDDQGGSDNSGDDGNSSDNDNSSGDGDSGDGDSSGESESDSGGEGEESNEDSSNEDSKDEKSDEKSEESDKEEKEEVEEEKKEEKEEEKEEKKEEKEEKEEEEEEKKEESKEEEEEEEEEKEKTLAPPIVTANLVTMQMMDGVLTQAASFGYSQSSLTGKETYSVNGMVWSNLKQFSINFSQSSVYFNWDKEVPIMVLDPDTGKYYKFGSYKDQGSIMMVQSVSAGYMKMFSTHIATAGISNVYMGQKENFWKGFVGGFALTGMGVFLEDGEAVTTAAFTAFGTKPFPLKRLTISPMLAYSHSPFTYAFKAKQATWTYYGTYIIGSNFDFKLSQRFNANIGGTVIGNTQPGIPMSYALTVGSRFQF